MSSVYNTYKDTTDRKRIYLQHIFRPFLDSIRDLELIVEVLKLRTAVMAVVHAPSHEGHTWSGKL